MLISSPCLSPSLYSLVKLLTSCEETAVSCLGGGGLGTGIGLRNIRQRLSLIYGDKASLELNVSRTTYTVNLTLPAHAVEDSYN